MKNGKGKEGWITKAPSARRTITSTCARCEHWIREYNRNKGESSAGIRRGEAARDLWNYKQSRQLLWQPCGQLLLHVLHQNLFEDKWSVLSGNHAALRSSLLSCLLRVLLGTLLQRFRLILFCFFFCVICVYIEWHGQCSLVYFYSALFSYYL